MTTATVREIGIPYKKSDKQKAFHDLLLTKYVTGFKGGVASGKTYAGAMEAIRHALYLMPGSKGGILAPTNKILTKYTQATFLELLPPELVTSFNQTNQIMTIRTGKPKPHDITTIHFGSAEDPKSIPGGNWDWGWGDEVSFWRKVAYRFFVARMRGSRDEYREQARAWLTFTPKGSGWLRDSLEKSDTTYVSATSHDNPHLTERYLNMLTEDYGGTDTQFYKQEMLGEWVKFEGLIYAMIEDGTHYLERPLQEMVRFAAGVDWGYEHPWVFVVAGQDEAGRWHIFEELYQTHLTTDGQIEAVLDLMRRYSLEAVYCPDDRPENIEAYGNAGIPAVSYKRDVVQGVPCVAQAMAVGPDGKAKCTFSASAPRTYAECKSYQWKTRPEGVSGKEEPLKIKDDGPDAVRSLIHGDHQAGGGEDDEIFLLGNWGD
jgi:phage terminase large subunit